MKITKSAGSDFYEVQTTVSTDDIQFGIAVMSVLKKVNGWEFRIRESKQSKTLLFMNLFDLEGPNWLIDFRTIEQEIVNLETVVYAEIDKAVHFEQMMKAIAEARKENAA